MELLLERMPFKNDESREAPATEFLQSVCDWETSISRIYRRWKLPLGSRKFIGFWPIDTARELDDRRGEAVADDSLQKQFNERAERWEMETAAYSAPGAKFLNKDMLWIITRGMEIVPLIISRLRTSHSDWFWALENITQENPAENAVDYESAVKYWEEWLSGVRNEK